MYSTPGQTIEQNYSFLQSSKNATRAIGFKSEQKCTVALRMLAYVISGESMDPYVRMTESTAIDRSKLFTLGVAECLKDNFLGPKNGKKPKRFFIRHSERGFTTELGLWNDERGSKNGLYSISWTLLNKNKVRKVKLEDIADNFLYISHSFFSFAAFKNFLAALDASHAFC